LVPSLRSPRVMAPLISASVQAPIPFSLPYDFYKVFTTSDLDAVVAYVRSVAPVSNKVQTPVYKAAMHGDIPPGAEKQMTAADLDTPVKRGFTRPWSTTAMTS
jgi:hypothetical protein